MAERGEHIVELAIREYERDGIVSTTTFMALNLIGLDADAIIKAIEESRPWQNHTRH